MEAAVDKTTAHRILATDAVTKTCTADEYDDETVDMQANDGDELGEDDGSGFGSIEKIELVNFMCHSFLEVSLGPKINFIVGHNGSGKSAILTALTVCLGGKASFTNRGTNLRALLKEGEDVGSVAVHIRNRGPDAYMPKIYGGTIIVERKLAREGAMTYKIMNEKRRVISHRHEDLMSICDHMQIVVDNPMAILTQDTARMFLANSSATDKYNFFLKGTQLEKLLADYLTIEEYLDNSAKILTYKKAALPDMEREVQSLQTKWREMEEALKIEEQFNQLRTELIWAKIQDQEEHVEHQQRLLLQEQEKLQSIEPHLAFSEMEHARFEAEIAQMAAQLHSASAEADPVAQSKNTLVNQAKESKALYNQATSEIRVLDKELQTHKSHSERLRNYILEEQRKLQSDQAAARNAKLAQISQLEMVFEDLKAKHHACSESRDQMSTRSMALDRERHQIEENLRQAEHQLKSKQSQIRSIHSHRANEMSKYGDRIPELIHRIKEYESRGKWRGRTPLGPLGMPCLRFDVVYNGSVSNTIAGLFIELQREDYADIIETLLASSLASFVVETYEDMKLLQELARSVNLNYLNISKCSARRIDTRNNEPDDTYLTVDRCLKISNDAVHAQIVIAHNIEKLVLVATRQEGDDMCVRGYPRNVNAVFTKDCYQLGSRHGGFNAMRMHRPRDAIRMTKNLDGVLQALEREEAELLNHIAHMRMEYDNRAHEIAHITNQLNVSRDEDPSRISALEEEKMDSDRKIEVVENQINSLKAQAVHSRQVTLEYSAQIRAVDAQLIEITNRIQQLQNEVEQLSSSQLKHKQNLNHFLRKRDEYCANIAHLSDGLRQMQAALETNIRMSLELGPRIPVSADSATLQRKINTLRGKLDEKERQLGSREAVYEELVSKQTALKHAQTDLAKFTKFLQFLRRSIFDRHKSFEEFKSLITVRAKSMFSEILRKRGYRGSLSLDHDKKELNIKVDVSEVERSKHTAEGDNDRDPRALSG
eukprot:jgi/Hompol1/86/HPOL_004267-RA